ncbi:Putative FAD-binding domain, FAD/NAD(P)-binding domain superfamily [Septoria linicola]|uniref:FAD-binding domain, FAD/NAD(P)-binding domain superfamily n=1 Tax=Septoria linicola TaxID=215465 RepID=A0A9Q9EFF6_9PEZI|nr:putative FAD-binding domain, FAD/NAD(P)-binding domain superfamily [Septoria linicola]USW47178.1 Putative FAD-binding domain, FAD/NAD(P)-binding domain superfamily [Septoria linicola]
MEHKTPQRLTVLIIGGGVGGLVAAVSFAQAGHDVTVIEHKSRYNDEDGESRQGLNLTRNAVECLASIGITEDFLGIADFGQDLQIKSYKDGSSVRKVRTLNGHSVVHRSDLLRLLIRHATKADAKIHINQSFLGMIEHESGVGVMLQDGRCLQADIVIGADGIHSQTRGCIDQLKDIKPILTEHCTFLVDVEKEAMERHEASRQLYDDGKQPFQFWMGPERSIVGWTMTRHNQYHLQINDHAYGNNSAYANTNGQQSTSLVSPFDQMDAFRARWADFEPAINAVLEETKTCTQWKIAELPDLPKWSSPGGRIILLGDAAHAMPPYAGQGAAMAMEDAIVLSTLLSLATKIGSIKEAANAYEKVRRPRVQRFKDIVYSNVKTFGSGGEDEDKNEERKWTSEERYHWIDDYRAKEEAEQYVAKVQI